jgi:hypothetical protein
MVFGSFMVLFVIIRFLKFGATSQRKPTGSVEVPNGRLHVEVSIFKCDPSLPRLNPILNFKLRYEVSNRAIRRASSNSGKQTLNLLVFETSTPCGIVLVSALDLIVEVFDGKTPQNVATLLLTERYLICWEFKSL